MLAGSILLFGSVRTGYDGTNGQTDTASFSKDGGNFNSSSSVGLEINI